MNPVQTLHEFVQTLLGDAQSMANFNADPQGMLNAAGLTDVAPADVQELMPLLTGTLSDLPNLSGVFESVSDAATATGLNTIASSALNGVSDVNDSLAGALGPVPVVGPLVEAQAIDMQNMVAGIDQHLYDGKLVGAVVDGTTNHLGDSLLATTAIDTVRSVPGIGEPLGGVADQVRAAGDSVLGQVNEAIGSTPIGASIGMSAAESGGTMGAAGDVAGTLDQVTSVAPVASAVPATEGLDAVDTLDAVPAVGESVGLPAPAVGDVAGTVNETVSHLPVDVPAVGDVAGAAAPAGGVTDVAGGVTDAADNAVSSVTSGVDHVTGNLNVPGTEALPSTNHLLDIGL